jgi:hypothetical protein
MQAIPGATANNDPLDAPKSAAVLRGGRLPPADVSPATRHATRDWRRRRRPRAHQRAALLAPVPTTPRPYPLPAMGTKLTSKANRAGVAERCAEAAGHQRSEGARALLTSDDARLREVERPIVTTAKPQDAHTRDRRHTVPGIGPRRRRVRLDAIPEVHRCPRVQDCVSSCRLGQWARAAAGTRYGTSGAKSGQAPRTGACAEAAVWGLRDHPAAHTSRARLATTQAKGTALPLLAQQLARAVSDRRKRHGACARAQCCQRSTRRAGSRCAAGRTGQPGDAPHRGARHGGRPGVRARPGAARSPCPEPSAVMGQPRSLLVATARGANDRRVRLLTRAWCSLDNVDAWRPICAEAGRRAPRHVSVAAHSQTRLGTRRPGGESTSRRVWCSHVRSAPSYGHHVSTPDRLLTVPGIHRRKKSKKSALRSSWSLDKRGPHTGSAGDAHRAPLSRTPAHVTSLLSLLQSPRDGIAPPVQGHAITRAPAHLVAYRCVPP